MGTIPVTYNNTPDYGVVFGDGELRQAIANARVMQLLGIGGGGSGGSSGTQYSEGNNTAIATGTVLLFRRTDGTFKALQGDNSDRIKVIADISNAIALDATAQAIRDRLPTQQGTWTKSATTATNAIQNTWSQVLTARATRVSWVVANLSDTAIQVGYGGTGSEQVYLPVPAGGAVGQSINQVNFSNADIGAISVICPTATQKAIAVSEVYL